MDIVYDLPSPDSVLRHKQKKTLKLDLTGSLHLTTLNADDFVHFNQVLCLRGTAEMQC